MTQRESISKDLRENKEMKENFNAMLNKEITDVDENDCISCRELLSKVPLPQENYN